MVQNRLLSGPCLLPTSFRLLLFISLVYRLSTTLLSSLAILCSSLCIAPNPPLFLSPPLSLPILSPSLSSSLSLSLPLSLSLMQKDKNQTKTKQEHNKQAWIKPATSACDHDAITLTTGPPKHICTLLTRVLRTRINPWLKYTTSFLLL